MNTASLCGLGTAVFIALSSNSAFALECAAKFDKDGDGIVAVGAELDLCILHATSAIHRKYDKNLNGMLDYPSETDAIERASRTADAFVLAQIDVEDALGGKPGLPAKPAVVADAGPPAAEGPPKPYNVTGGILVRKAYEAAGVLNIPKDVRKVGGAYFSILDDLAAKKYVVTASGVVEAYRRWDRNPDALTGDTVPSGITEIGVHIGAEFNRKFDSSAPGKGINSLTLRTGGELGVQGMGTDYHFLRANVFDATDFDFSSHVLGAEAEWEPVLLPLGIGVARQVPGMPVYYRWRPVLHAEYEEAIGSGARTLFVGPVVEGEVWFAGALDRLYLDGTYWAMWDPTGMTLPFQYAAVSANWNLDPAGHVALSLLYRNGNLPKTLQAVNDITLGLTTKF